MALDEQKKSGGKGPEKGVWKSGKGKGRTHTKGRQLQDDALEEVRALLADAPRRARSADRAFASDTGRAMAIFRPRICAPWPKRCG